MDKKLTANEKLEQKAKSFGLDSYCIKCGGVFMAHEGQTRCPHCHFQRGMRCVGQLAGEVYPNAAWVDCLWCRKDGEVAVRKVWISGPQSDQPIGSTDGYDDWGHYVIPWKGEFGEARFDYLDIEEWLNQVLSSTGGQL